MRCPQGGGLIHVEQDEVILNPVQQTQLMASMDAKNALASNSMKETNELLKGILGATSRERTIVTDSQVKQISYTGGLGGPEIPAYS